ncbi:Pvc16 family protein [Pollutibacter soli]|uniref:Pvc16 family protein n=1 Tax=Pollutibacter soli TaxID=3034157 RepID=UPI0030133674
MIDVALQTVVDSLNDYFAQRMGLEHPDPTPYVILDNVAKYRQAAHNNAHIHHSDNVVLTVVNLEKSSLHHSSPHHLLNSGANASNSNSYRIHLHCLFSITVEPYNRALQFLGLITDYFHLHPVFEFEQRDGEKNKIAMEQVVLNFEENQQLWSMLGGNLLPSVMFRAALQMHAVESKQLEAKTSGFPYLL